MGCPFNGFKKCDKKCDLGVTINATDTDGNKKALHKCMFKMQTEILIEIKNALNRPSYK